MGAPAGWRVVKGRARYWDGDQWVGGDFDPATVSPQLLAESAGSAAPSMKTTARASASPSIRTSAASAAPSVGAEMPAPAGPGRSSKAEAQAQAKASVERWAEDLMSGRLPGAMDPSHPSSTVQRQSPSAPGAGAQQTARPPASRVPQTPQRKGPNIGKIVGFIIAGWFLLNFLGSILSDILP